MSDTPKDPQQLQRIAPRSFSLMPQSLGEAKEIALLIANSDFAPKDYKGRPDNVIIAIQMGADLGLKPLQALQNIAVINGRPSIYGDAALALVMPALDRFHEAFEGVEGSDNFTAVCIAKRKGWPDETRRTFSVADAKAAKLWGKRGRDGQDTPWITYPKRMLQWRARGFTLRDVGADLLLGLVLVEEAQDYPDPTHVGSGQSEGAAAVTEQPKSLTIFEQLPEAIRDTIEKAFTVLNFSPGARLTKLNEYFGGDAIQPEDQAQLLLDWLKDEYAKRRTGMPRAKKGNGKDKSTSHESAGDSAPKSVADSAWPSGSVGGDTDGRPAGAEAPAVGSGQVAPPTPVEAVKPAVKPEEDGTALF